MSHGPALTLLLELAQAAPDSMFFDVIDDFLEQRFDGEPVWRNLRPQNRADDAGRRSPSEGENTYLLDRNLPSGIAEVWGERVPVLSEAEWAAMDPRRPARLIRIGAPEMIGPILRFSVSFSGRRERPPGASPALSLSGSSYCLAFWDGTWWTLTPGWWWIA